MWKAGLFRQISPEVSVHLVSVALSKPEASFVRTARLCGEEETETTERTGKPGPGHHTALESA